MPEQIYDLFEHAPVGFALLENDTLIKNNPAFKHSVGKSVDLHRSRLSDLFNLSSQQHEKEYSAWCKRETPRVTLKSVRAYQAGSEKFTVFFSRIDSACSTQDSFCIVIPDFKNEEKIEYPVSKKIIARNRKLKGQEKHQEQPVYFTNRELEILKLSSKGLQVKQIAKVLGLSARTVEKHRYNIIHKTDSSNITEALYYSGKWGLF